MNTYPEFADYLKGIADGAMTVLESGKSPPNFVVMNQIIETMLNAVATGTRYITYNNVCDIVSRMEISVSEQAWDTAETNIIAAAKAFGKLYAKLYDELGEAHGYTNAFTMMQNLGNRGSFTIE